MENKEFINYPKGVKGTKGVKGIKGTKGIRRDIKTEELKELLTKWGEMKRLQRARQQGFESGQVIGFFIGWLISSIIYLVAVYI